MLFRSIFATVAGYFALQPMMAQARAGLPTPLGFAALHGISLACYGVKALAVLVLAWRAAWPPAALTAPSS